MCHVSNGGYYRKPAAGLRVFDGPGDYRAVTSIPPTTKRDMTIIINVHTYTTNEKPYNLSSINK